MNRTARSLAAIMSILIAAMPGFCLAAAYFITDLGTLGGSQTHLHGISPSGQVVGEANTPGDASTRAVQFTGGIQDLGTLGGTSAFAWGINDSGQITGYSQTTVGSFAIHAFLYSGGSMHDMGTLGGNSSLALGINDSGRVAGDSKMSGDAASHAFRFSAGVMQDLGSLGGPFVVGYAINASGLVVGYSSLASGGNVHAFLSGGTTMHDLGTLPGGQNGDAYGINANGQIVGDSGVPNGGVHAFLLTGGVMKDLNDLIDPASGWLLGSAEAINDAGQITGYGTINGVQQFHAFLLTPLLVPEPSSFVLAALSGAGVAAWNLLGRRARQAPHLTASQT